MQSLSIFLDILIEPIFILEELSLIDNSLEILRNTRFQFNDLPHVLDKNVLWDFYRNFGVIKLFELQFSHCNLFHCFYDFVY